MNKIVITGATGFVGKNLSSYLEDLDFEIQKLSVRDNWNDIINLNSNAIIHLAGKAHDTKNTSEASTYFEVNTELTKQLFDFFLQSSCNDFIYFSSVKAVADEVENILLETEHPNPKTPYGKSKLEAENYILSLTLPNKKRVFIIRPCMIHGPKNKGNLNLLYKVVSKGIPYPLGSYNNERSFLSIDNLNFVISEILKNKSINSGIYNLADDEFVSTNKLIAIIAKAQNKNPIILNIPISLINIVATLGNYLKLPLNTERLTKLTENYKVSNSKIKDALKIEKFPYTAEEGLLKTIKSLSK